MCVYVCVCRLEGTAFRSILSYPVGSEDGIQVELGDKNLYLLRYLVGPCFVVV